MPLQNWKPSLLHRVCEAPLPPASWHPDLHTSSLTHFQLPVHEAPSPHPHCAQLQGTPFIHVQGKSCSASCPRHGPAPGCVFGLFLYGRVRHVCFPHSGLSLPQLPTLDLTKKQNIHILLKNRALHIWNPASSPIY